MIRLHHYEDLKDIYSVHENIRDAEDYMDFRGGVFDCVEFFDNEIRKGENEQSSNSSS